MSNFFTNLVMRSLTPTPNVLQPRLPSLFEAPAGSEPVLEESQGIHTREETTPIPPDPSSLTRLPTERSRVHEPFTEPSRETRKMHQSIPPVMPEEPRRATAQIQDERQEIVSHKFKAETTPEERKQVIVPHVEAAGQPAREKQQPASIQESAPSLIPVLASLEPSHPIPQAEHPVNTNLVSPEANSPTVRIHIGRIEVRAVTQSAPPARPVTSSRPKVTLDEYLLRRNEGKR